jgi:Tfp pilus assembly protein PilN
MKAINLLPTDLRGTPKGDSRKAKAAAANDEPGGIGAFVVLGALAACVVALAAYVLTTNSVKDRQAQLDSATAQAQTIAQRASQLKPYADFQQMAQTRIQTVNDLAASRFDWEQALRDISRAIPSDVTLSSLTGSISSDAQTGGSAVRSAIASPAIELKGCAKTQTQVAQLLSRLRSVDGATRVTLSKSERPDKTAPQSGGAVATADGSTTEGLDCGPHRAPLFELVMFFERSKVPSSVTDISVTPSSGAAPATGAAAGTTATATGTTATGTTATGGTSQPASGGVTTPPADPATSGDGTATPASTPQGGGAQ